MLGMARGDRWKSRCSLLLSTPFSYRVLDGYRRLGVPTSAQATNEKYSRILSSPQIQVRHRLLQRLARISRPTLFVSGGRIDRVRLSPLPPRFFRLPPSSLNSPSWHHSRQQFAHEESRQGHKASLEIKTDQPSSVSDGDVISLHAQTTSWVIYRIWTRELHSRRRTDAYENLPTHRS